MCVLCFLCFESCYFFFGFVWNCKHFQFETYVLFILVLSVSRTFTRDCSSQCGTLTPPQGTVPAGELGGFGSLTHDNINKRVMEEIVF